MTAREDQVIAAVLRFAGRVGNVETCAASRDPAVPADDDERMSIDHDFDAARIIALKSLARSRGIALEHVLRAAMRNDLAGVVMLPTVSRRQAVRGSRDDGGGGDYQEVSEHGPR